MALVEIKKNPSRRELRQFAGLWLPAFLIGLGVVAWHRWGSGEAVLGLAITALLSAALGLIKPEFSRKLYLGWMYAAYPIGWTVSFLVLAIIYFLILTPIGLILRGLGRQPLSLKFDRRATSYWTPRPQSPKMERYFRQF